MRRGVKKVYWPLFIIFFKAGTFTFAGGLAMLPVIEKDIVDKYSLLGRDEFLEYATLSQTLPGVIAVNCASFVGRSVAGTPGMLIASLGATFSAFVLMLIATILVSHIPQNGPVIGAMQCIRAASSALVLAAAFTLGAKSLRSAFSVILMLASFAAVVFLNISTPLVVIAAGFAGYGYRRIIKQKEAGSDGADS